MLFHCFKVEQLKNLMNETSCLNVNFSESKPFVNVVCSVENKFGFNTSSPCVFLKLNKVIKQKRKFELFQHDFFLQIFEWIPQENVELNCTVTKGKDKIQHEEIEYFPSEGFLKVDFPFVNNKKYRSPLVAVNFKNLEGQLRIEI